jgi:hypothetical protein
VEDVRDEPLYRSRVCGVDVGKAELYATIRVPSEDNPARRASETRRFATTRRGVLELADWLRCWQVPAMVMEATGGFWKGPFYRLEAEGFDCVLADARQVKNLLQEDLESNGSHAIEITFSQRPGKMPPVTGYLVVSRRSVADGRAEMGITMPTRIGRDELRELTGQRAQLVEVLPADDYDWAHLPAAVNLPLKELDARAGQLDRSRPVIVYCHDSL